MAFCPNCGTPNTDQADKCVNCNNALTPASPGGKFKGTIMMGAAGGAPPKPEEAAPQAQPPAGAGAGSDPKSLAFQKTMMGPMVAPQAPQPGAPAPQQPAAPDPAAQVGTAPTLEHDAAAPGQAQGPAAAPPQAAPPSRGFSQPGGYDDPPQLPQSNATKTMMMVLGASVVIAALIVGAALFMR